MVEPAVRVTMHVRVIVKRVHLVHHHALQVVPGLIERIEHGHRLAVGQGNDHMRARTDEVEHRLRRGWDDGIHGDIIAQPTADLTMMRAHPGSP